MLEKSIIDPQRVEPADLMPLSAPDTALDTLDRLPTLLEADELALLAERRDLLLVDVRTLDQCVDGHIPGAVMLDYAELLSRQGEASGLLPAAAHLSRVLSGIGLTRERHVVAYNDDNGSHAARLLWTLDLLDHRRFSLLNGGFAAWDDLDLPVAPEPAQPAKSTYQAMLPDGGWADVDYVLANLDNPDVVLLDTRSPEEYAGRQVRASRGGHIPGAVNLDWAFAIDLLDNGRLRPDGELLDRLHQAGVTPDKEIIPYCQTHHRSAHTSFVLKHLGYPRVRSYPGSWSEWGNRDDLPVK